MPPKPCPPGLLPVRDILERYPADRAMFLIHEIRRRERELTLYRSVRGVSHFQLWEAVRSTIVTGVLLFLLIMGVGEVAKLSQWVVGLQSSKIPIPIPFVKGVNLDIGQYMPSSTVITLAAQLPAWDWRDAGVIVAAIVAALLAFRLVTGYIVWKRSRVLRTAMIELEDEVDVLRSWRS